jgi:hypothetical protein
MMGKSGKPAALAAILGLAIILSSCGLDGLVLHEGDHTAEEKAVMGLKTALQVGIDSGSMTASKVNGYLENKAIRIQVPEEAKQALAAAEAMDAVAKPYKSKMESLRFTFERNHGGLESQIVENGIGQASIVISQVIRLEGLCDSLIKYMNRAAELAAPRSVPIFKVAIADMDISDGLSLLNSPDSTAATGILDSKTSGRLSMAYAPLIDSTLNLVPMAEYWEEFQNAYGQLLNRYSLLEGTQMSWNSRAINASTKVNIVRSITYPPIPTEDPGQWITEHALVGLFFLVGEEEKDIRRDPYGYAKGLAPDDSRIIKEAFGEIMEMEK